MNNSQDSELIFEKYATQIANEGLFGDIASNVINLGSKGARALGKTKMGQKILGAAPPKPGSMMKNLVDTKTANQLTKGQEAGRLATRVVAPAALGATGLYGAKMAYDAITSEPTAPAAPAAPAAPYGPLRSKENKPAISAPSSSQAAGAGADVFKKFHGTDFDPNSRVDREKMQHIQSLQKQGTPLTASSVYNPAPAAASATTNPPGTMVSRGLEKVGRGLGTGLRSIAGAAVAPVKGIYKGLTGQ